MLPNSDYLRISHRLVSPAAPRDAWVVYCVRNNGILNVEGVADACDTVFASTLALVMTTEWSLSETIAKEGPDDTGASAQFSQEGGVGTFAPPTATPQVSYLLIKSTALGGRRGRGRMYIPGVKESYVGADGALDSTATSAIAIECADFMSGLNAVDLPLYLEHDPATTWQLVNGQPRRVPTGSVPPNPTLVSSLTVSPLVATQRRRLR